MSKRCLRGISLAIAGLLLLSACSSGSDEAAGPTTTRPARSPADLGIDLSLADRCDPIVADRCLLPFPNDFYTVADRTTATGRRVALVGASLPTNAAGKTIDPTPWNRNDGFSPGSPLLVSLPGVDLEKSNAAAITDIGASLDEKAPIVVVDTDTGKRHPYWVELDPAAKTDAERTVIVRAAVDYREGHHYVIGIRNLVDATGKTLEASPAFASYRDAQPTTDSAFESRRPAMEDDVTALDKAGVKRGDLQLAWDFTVASAENLAGPMLAIRDDAFTRLGDQSPAFTIDKVEENPEPRVRRRIDGTIQVPLYLTKGGVTGSALNLDDDGVPSYAGSNLPVRFRCQIPVVTGAAATETGKPARMALYGHGLLGSTDELGSDLVEDMAARHNLVYCGTNWIGMAEEDIPTAIAALSNLSEFHKIPERELQGFLNVMYLGRAMKHAKGFVADPAFQLDGKPLINADELYYDGNSQGAILGGAFMAVSQDITRGVLGEAGMNYSLLLQRSVDFDDYKLVLDPNYPDPYDQLVALTIIQMLWDRGETNGYAQHLTTDPYADTPAKTVLLLGALGDHQVTEYSLQIEARTMGVPGHDPYTAPDRTRGDEHGWGITPIDRYPSTGSGYFLWDTGSPMSPLTNTPPREGHDPHDDTPNIPAVQDLKDGFMHTDGTITDVCDGDPCTGPPHD